MILGVLALFMVGLCGCAYRAPVVPPVGIVYTNHRAPLDVEYHDTTLGKRGTASSHSVLGLVAWGDASAEAAASAGGIKTIEHADLEYLNVIFIYQRFTTIVYGK
jgi:hypothetical protein